jgi:hypothetical protein
MLRVNKYNTLFFGDDLEHLLMSKERIVNYIENSKSMYSYHTVIWANENGWYLTVNVYRNDDLKLIE